LGLHPTSEHASVYTEEELRRLIDVSRQSGQLKAEEQQFIHRVFEFSDAEVREAMVPRTQVTALPLTATLDDARAAFLLTGYSRLPVYGEQPDDILGLLFRKDLDMGRINGEGFDLKRLIRPPAFIPATASLGKALRQMQAERLHFVFVVDEHGSIEGILTLEDLLEEIVGEINDEYDEEVREQISKDGKTYVLDGMLSVRDANQHLELNLPEDANYTTIAGFLMERAGRVLKTGDRIKHEGGVFVVEQVDKRRISRLRWIPHTNTEQGASVNSLLSAAVLAGQTATNLAVGTEPFLSYI
jgi:CBS domain containing-hemolysin-like protein